MHFSLNSSKIVKILLVLAVSLATANCIPSYNYTFPHPFNPDFMEAPSKSMKFILDNMKADYKISVDTHDYYNIADPFCLLENTNANCNKKISNPAIENFVARYRDDVMNYINKKRQQVRHEDLINKAYDLGIIHNNHGNIHDRKIYYEQNPKELLKLLPEHVKAGLSKEEYYTLLDPTCVLTKAARQGASCGPVGKNIDKINLYRQLLSKIKLNNNMEPKIKPKKPDYSSKAEVDGFSYPATFFSTDGKYNQKKRTVFQLGVFPTDQTGAKDYPNDSKIKLSIFRAELSPGFNVNDDGYSFDLFDIQAETKFISRYKIAKDDNDDLGRDKGILQYFIYGVFISTLNKTALNAGLFDIVSTNLSFDTQAYIPKNIIKNNEIKASYQGLSYGLFACNANSYTKSCLNGYKPDFERYQRAIVRIDLEVKNQSINLSGQFEFENQSLSAGISNVYFKSASLVEIPKFVLVSGLPSQLSDAADLAVFKADLCDSTNRNSCTNKGITRFVFAGRDQEKLDEVGGIYRIYTNNKTFVGSYGARVCENYLCASQDGEEMTVAPNR